MMDVICKICNQTIHSRGHWWKYHQISEKEYFETYEPRFDLYTKHQLEFKNPDTYFLNDFGNRGNLKKYLESNDKTVGYSYCKSWLERRKALKNLVYAPCQFELKSHIFPTIAYFNHFFGPNTYQELCRQLGLIVRYDYNQVLRFKLDPITICIDTRENSPLIVSGDKILGILPVGDYAPVPNVKNIFVERKSLTDLIGTLSKGYERFQREVRRARSLGSYIIVLIENSYRNLENFDLLRLSKFSKATPQFVLKRIRDLLIEFDNIQFLAVNNRMEACAYLMRIFQLENDVRTVDLQYFYDLKKF